MKRLLWIAVGIGLTLLAAFITLNVVKMPLAFAGQKIELWYDEGGSPSHYADRARAWKKRGDYIIIRDMQVSSAAYAVLYAWKDLGVKMCYGKTGFNARPSLWLHQTRFGDPKTGKWHYRDEAFIRWGIRTPTGEKFGQRFRVMHPKEIGIPACPKGIKGDTKIVPAPYIYRLR